MHPKAGLTDSIWRCWKRKASFLISYCNGVEVCSNDTKQFSLQVEEKLGIQSNQQPVNF